MKTETILLTGGAGFIGTHTAVALLQAGYEVVVADNLCNSEESAVRAVETIAGRSVEFVKLDVCDAQALDALFAAHEFSAVVHFAGLKAVGESVAQPLRYYRNNLDATITLLECMERSGVKRLVFSSSATVYGDAHSPIPETAPAGRCSNPYGWTKYMSEQIIRDYAAAHPDFSAALLRYFNPVGAHESGLIGENPKDRPNNLMPLIVNAAFGGEMLHVFGDDYDTPDGTGIRDYLHVSDLAEGHAAAIAYTRDHRGAEAINLGTGRGISVLELIGAYERVNGVRVPHEMAPRRPGDVAVCFADARKAAEVLGWKATRSVEEMCRSAHRYRETKQ